MILKYYNEYKKAPTSDVLALETKKDTISDMLKISVVESFKRIYSSMNESDDEYVQEEALNFCKNQSVKKGMLKGVDLLKSGQYEQIRQVLNEALKAGQNKDYGHDYDKDFEERYDATNRKCVQLPWEVLTELSDGGLGKGELGIVTGPSGVGKSWVLVAIGAHALKLKKNVIHYTLELGREYVGLRYDANLTGYEFQELKYHKDDIKKALGEMDLGRLIIKKFSPARHSINSIQNHVMALESTGFKADIIIIDYADLMIPASTGRGVDGSYEIYGTVYEEIRGLLGELEVPGWTASQANRCHFIKDKVITEFGEKEIGKLNSDDRVLTHLGFKKITKIYPITTQPIYRIKTKSGKTINVSANHELPTLYKQCKSISTGLKPGDKLFTKKM